MLARTTSCEPERLHQLLDGNLPEHTEAEVARHVETCDSCRAKLESIAADESWWHETRELLADAFQRASTSPLLSGEGGRRPGEGSETFAVHCESDASNSSSTSQRDRIPHPDPLPKGEGEIKTDSTVVRFLAPSDNPAMLGRFGEFEVLEVIGRGGMGIVLKGYDHELNRWVAIKMLAPQYAENAAARKRFAREAQAAAAIVHPHVIGIHAVDAAHQPPYFVMPFVPGESLQQRLDRVGTLNAPDVLRIAQQVADGLAAAHAQGLVHRDIKPANILLERNVERVVLTDFGLARAVDDASLTQSGVIAGTPQYMSPEQARGESVDARTDLFSLGTVMYTMLAGHLPFRAETPWGVLRRITDETPRSLREINPSVPEWLEAFVLKLLAKDQQARWQSAREVAGLLTNCLAHVQQPTVAALPSEVRSLVNRHTSRKARSLIAAGAALVFSAALRLCLSQAILDPQSNTAGQSADATVSRREAETQSEAPWDDELDRDIQQMNWKLQQLESDADF